MRTVTDVNTVSQLLTYSKQAEAGIHQKAIQMLLGAGNNKKQDSLSISDATRGHCPDREIPGRFAGDPVP